MKERIRRLCRELEKQHNIRILFAVENGSRAWHFASKDSDYDVRFVFVRQIENYIQIRPLDDVITAAYDREGKPCPVEGSLIDMSGFDVFKFTTLLASSNPTTIEWLISDIIYLSFP